MDDTGEARIETADVVARQATMARCAAATVDELRAALASFDTGGTELLRAPEVGLVIAQGRISGDGRPFNVGEVTVTRATLRLGGGELGFAYHLGRDREKARLAATLDALAQRAGGRQAVDAALAPVATRLAAERERQARRTAATRVNFFAVARGEDE